jgi:hypothetical protein
MNKNVQKYSKTAAVLAALVLAACSGHKVGDPTEKYGDLQRLATDNSLREIQDPTRAPRVDIDLQEMRRILEEGEEFSFQVRVRMDVGFEDVPHILHVTSDNKGVTVRAERTQVTGALTYWNVSGRVASDFLQFSEDTASLSFEVIFGEISDPRKAEALRGSKASRQGEVITIKRAVKKAEIIDVRTENRFEVGQKVAIDVIVDAKGTAVEGLKWNNSVLLQECDASKGESCDYSNLLSIAPLEAANNKWTTTLSLDLTNWSLEEGQENSFVVQMVLASPNGGTSERRKTITVYRPQELKAPAVSLTTEAPEQVARGENFEISLNVEMANSIGELQLNEDELIAQMGAGWSGEVKCEAASEGREVCTFSGQFSCDASTGAREAQFIFAAVDGDKIESNSPYTVSFEIIEGEACHE